MDDNVKASNNCSYPGHKSEALVFGGMSRLLNFCQVVDRLSVFNSRNNTPRADVAGQAPVPSRIMDQCPRGRMAYGEQLGTLLYELEVA